MNQPDFIIVGAGSAGCILARRLAYDFGRHVTLVESPSTQAPSIDQKRPARWMKLLRSAEDWDFDTQPSKSLANRRLRWPRGRGVGGSSRINAMIWLPPTEKDLARLSDVTAGCWNREKLHRALQSVEQIVRPEYPRWLSVASKAFLRSVDQFPNSNPMAYRRLQKNGTRRSLEVIFNDDRETTDDKKRDPHRGKVEWIRGTVNDIQWRGDQAVGVTMQSTQGACQLSCKDGVILAAGSIGTPAILMRSGVGPKAILTDLGIPVRNDQQAIGQQVADHLIMPVIFRQKDSKNRFSLDVNPRELARWQTLGTGPASSNLAECGGLFMNDRFQLHVTPTHYLSFPKLDDAAWISIGVNVTQPKSRGELRITSANPDVPPEIHPNYFSHSDDLEETVRGIQFVRGLIQDEALSEIIDCESLPGEKRQSELALQRTIPRYAQTLYHPLGSCPVGTAKSATIDPQFRLRHSDGLWVVDGSIFPGITVGNPNATIMSLAWMAAEEIMKTVKNP